MTAPTARRCRRCDPDAQCNDCREVARRRDFCACGHTRGVHHNNLGCLATMNGELCNDCTKFELRIEGTA